MRMRHYYGSYQTSLPPLISRPHKHHDHHPSHLPPRDLKRYHINLRMSSSTTRGLPVNTSFICDIETSKRINALVEPTFIDQISSKDLHPASRLIHERIQTARP